VVDPVERCCQVRVQDPRPLRVLALGDGEDRLDRVMTAPTGPETVAPRLEPGLPLGLQRIQHHGLRRPVGDHRDTERAPLTIRLGDVDPTDGPSPRPMPVLLDPTSQFHPFRPRQRGPAVDPGGPSPLVNLRDPARAEQRVRPGPQHQPLQATHPSVVPCPRCREDPLPQPPYLLLGPGPVHLVPVLGELPRSVHHHRGGGVQRPRRC
jgi:hypothetical protein